MSQQHMGYVDPAYLAKAADVTAALKRRSYEFMHIQPGHAVLDVGCGPATDTLPLAQLVGPTGRVVGIDHDPDMIAVANQRSVEVSSVVEHRQADALALPFDPNTFDACRAERVLQHLPNPTAALAEMIRVTQPGSWVVIADTDWSTLSIDYGEAIPDPQIEWGIRQAKLESLRQPYAGRQVYGWCKRAGLVEVTLESFGLFVTAWALGKLLVLWQQVEAKALERGLLTAEQVAAVTQRIEQADANGTLYCGTTMVLVAGRKP